MELNPIRQRVKEAQITSMVNVMGLYITRIMYISIIQMIHRKISLSGA